MPFSPPAISTSPLGSGAATAPRRNGHLLRQRGEGTRRRAKHLGARQHATVVVATAISTSPLRRVAATAPSRAVLIGFGKAVNALVEGSNVSALDSTLLPVEPPAIITSPLRRAAATASWRTIVSAPRSGTNAGLATQITPGTPEAETSSEHTDSSRVSRRHATARTRTITRSHLRSWSRRAAARRFSGSHRPQKRQHLDQIARLV